MFVNVEKDSKGFESGEDFMKERDRIVGSLKGGE